MHTQQAHRTALVLLHGIGEQRPMETVRGFVDGLFDERGRSKPDRLSELFEVRRLDVRTSGLNVDCYELYWAHHMQGSSWWHIAKWLWRMFRTPGRELSKMSSHLNPHLYTRTRIIVTLLVFMTVLITVVSTAAVKGMEGTFLGAALITAVALIIWWANYQILGVIGDAAQYLDSAPHNVGIRQAVRSECVRFLRTLSEADDPSYARIVLVGHSLGSVIAYDAIRLLWAQLKPHTTLHTGECDIHSVLSKLDASERPQSGTWLSPQRALFNQIRPTGGSHWKISDLITIGSPLTHAPLLLAESVDEFCCLIEQRELPTSPPQKDQGKTYAGWEESIGIKLHHAAPFAVTQWTNVYFPSDPIGGRLGPVFGPGIDDIRLPDAPKGSWSDHVHYWQSPSRPGSAKLKLVIRRLLDRKSPCEPGDECLEVTKTPICPDGEQITRSATSAANGKSRSHQ